MDDLISKLQQLVDQANVALSAAQTQQQEDPVWTAVKGALEMNGWSYGKTTEVPVSDGTE